MTSIIFPPHAVPALVCPTHRLPLQRAFTTVNNAGGPRTYQLDLCPLCLQERADGDETRLIDADDRRVEA